MYSLSSLTRINTLSLITGIHFFCLSLLCNSYPAQYPVKLLSVFMFNGCIIAPLF